MQKKTALLTQYRNIEEREFRNIKNLVTFGNIWTHLSQVCCKKAYENHDGWKKIRDPL